MHSIILVGSIFTEGTNMARSKSLENMSTAELASMEARIGQLKIEKQNAERDVVRQKIISLAKEHGFDIRELIDARKGNGKIKRGKVAVKYRDNAGNTWTGRGRMPRWMVAATRGGKAKKEDFSIA
jgi:DNA-binding protein H-NS